jgi:hypothetical protein
MPEDRPLALFLEDDKGTVLRGYCSDVEEARRRAQELADREGYPFLVFRFPTCRQIARFKPRAHRPLQLV